MMTEVFERVLLGKWGNTTSTLSNYQGLFKSNHESGWKQKKQL